jgi:hypothetical protein
MATKTVARRFVPTNYFIFDLFEPRELLRVELC